MSPEDRKKARELILEMLKAGPMRNFEIRMKLRDYGVDLGSSKVDHLIQAMRYENLIKYHKQKWLLSSAKVCKTCGGTGLVDDGPVAA